VPIRINLKDTELSFRPLLYTAQGLSEEDVIQIVLNKLQELNKIHEKSTHIAVVIYVSTTLDNPTIAMRTAHLTVKYLKDGIFINYSFFIFFNYPTFSY
jgi:hypothetical protein